MCDFKTMDIFILYLIGSFNIETKSVKILTPVTDLLLAAEVAAQPVKIKTLIWLYFPKFVLFLALIVKINC